MAKKIKDSGFKLLAIRPMEGCDANIRKNLKEGMLYKFYTNYSFYVKPQKELIELSKKNYKEFKTDKISEIKFNQNAINLYNLDDKPKINISAIVGKNGSGKSALTELFLKAMFDLSIQEEWINRKELEEQFKPQREFLENERNKIEKEITELASSHLDNTKKNELIDLGIIYAQYGRKIKDSQSYMERLENYEDSTLYFELVLINNEGEHIIVRKVKEKAKEGEEEEEPFITIQGIDGRPLEYDYKKLFYTIFMNYSIYGLNKNEIGGWIDFLYHKNDGYKTPVVINPQKTDGNIDINKEEKLSGHRINRTAFSEGKIADLNISDLKISLKNKQYNYEFRYDWDNDTLYVNNTPNTAEYKLDLGSKNEKELLNKLLNSNVKFKDSDIESINLIIKYFLGKLFKVDSVYGEGMFSYSSYTSSYQLKGLTSYIKSFLESNSHKYLKLKQVLDLAKNKISLCNKLIEYGKSSDWITLEYFKNEVLIKKREELDLKISFTSLFDVDYRLEDNSEYSKFSSGQKQLVNTLETINYHIRNLISNKEGYKSINIILDEIELYFHPEYQKRFINLMIESIQSLEISKDYSINVLFLTHSPFILSDIPASNILRMEDGEPSSKFINQTFGANIHNLLANDFFLTDGFMGEFAQVKIGDVINLINSTKTVTRGEILNASDIIELIGEPVIKNRLSKMLKEKFPSYFENNINDLDHQIKMQKEVLLDLENRRSNLNQDNETD